MTLFRASEDQVCFPIFLVKLLSETSLIFPEYSNHNKNHGQKSKAAQAFRAQDLTNAPTLSCRGQQEFRNAYQKTPASTLDLSKPISLVLVIAPGHCRLCKH